MRSMRARAWAVCAAWVTVLVALGAFVQQRLEIGTDLRLFLPTPQTPAQRLLIEEIGEGPGSRILILAISGAAPEELADLSRALQDELRIQPGLRFVSNGELSADALPEQLLAYRYLLSPNVSAQAFSVDRLRGELQARVRDLSSPAGLYMEPWIPRDPTLELLTLLQRWQPAQEPNRLFDVWFDAAGTRALLMVETQAAAFDPGEQRRAIEGIQSAFDALNTDGSAHLTITGAGRFSVLMEERTRSDAQRLGTAASIGMMLLLLLAYRRASSVGLSALPLASAGLAGLASVAALFGTVHGITLAFGFTLIGVAQDYPVHVLSHHRPSQTPTQMVRALWPTLATGVASTCIAYLTFAFSGVIGLAQLACFTIAGLITASLTTRFLLPSLLGPARRDYGESSRLQTIASAFARLRLPQWMILLLIAAALSAIMMAPQPVWENDLSKLTPVPTELIAEDQRLRAAIGASETRHLGVIAASDTQQALVRLEALDPELQALVSNGALRGYDHAARYVPSIHTQLTRQRLLPTEEQLAQTLRAALAGLPFRPGVFQAFIADVERARALQPLTPQALADTALANAMQSLLRETNDTVNAFVTLNGVNDLEAVRAVFERMDDGAMLLDLKQASESLVVRQRDHLLGSLAIASLLLAAVIGFALRDPGRTLRVLAPMLLTTLLVLAILRVSGVSLTHFHLIALMLAAGLGLDYALFFEHAAHDPAEHRRTLHGVLVCSASTLLVFALLATSQMPLLQALGVTVALGVVGNFVLALLLTQPRAARSQVGAGLPEPRTSMSISPTTRSAPPPGTLIPHQGAMCLLERIEFWNESIIRLTSGTHRTPDHPLRRNERLRSIHLCEYGAQAMAVHGGLKAYQTQTQPTPGMLVSLREVTFTREFIEDLPQDLLIEARCLQATATTLQYEFSVRHAQELLAQGRAAVVLERA